MINTASGIKIPFPDRIEEKYELSENRISLNISFEKLYSLITDFIISLEEPLFLFIHLSLKEQEEAKIRLNNTDPFHAEILYLDGQTKNQITEILNIYGTILLNDGISQFGIASHKTGDELFVKKYKIVDIYSKDINKHLYLTQNHNIVKTNRLITPWDTFSNENPGECSKVIFDNKDIYNVVAELKSIGLYSAEIVPD